MYHHARLLDIHSDAENSADARVELNSGMKCLVKRTSPRISVLTEAAICVD